MKNIITEEMKFRQIVVEYAIKNNHRILLRKDKKLRLNVCNRYCIIFVT